MASKTSYVPGDLVLVKFPDCGYWPCQITAIAKHGRREVKCFGEDSTGKAFPKCMVYYSEETEEKYISKASVKTYPHLAEALNQIKTCADDQNKITENKKTKQKKRKTIVGIGNSVKTECFNDVELPHEMAEGDSEGNDTEIACVGVTGSVGFIKNLALGEKGMMQSVKMESASGIENMENCSSQWGEAIKREIDEEPTGAGTDVDETGSSVTDNELDYKIKVELESDVDDFEADETNRIDAENQNQTNPNGQPSSSEPINENSIANEASCEDNSSRGTEVNHSGVNVDLPPSSPEGGDQEEGNGVGVGVVKMTMTCYMPTHVFTKFAPIFMEAASHSQHTDSGQH